MHDARCVTAASFTNLVPAVTAKLVGAVSVDPGAKCCVGSALLNTCSVRVIAGEDGVLLKRITAPPRRALVAPPAAPR
jgi:hypothetical protein